MYKINYNGVNYKTPYKIQKDTFLSVAPTIQKKVKEDYPSVQSHHFLVGMYDVRIKKIDGRLRINKDLPYFSWVVII